MTATASAGSVPFAGKPAVTMSVGVLANSPATPGLSAVQFNPDSAVTAGRRDEREANFPQRSTGKARLAPTLADIDRRWFKMSSKTYNDEARSSENDFDTVVCLRCPTFAPQGP
jgi:hypothetical protein